MSPPLRETLGNCPPGTTFTINRFDGILFEVVETITNDDGKIASYRCLTRTGGLGQPGEATLGAGQDYPEEQVQILP